VTDAVSSVPTVASGPPSPSALPLAAMRRILGVSLPFLSAERHIAQHPALRDAPVVLIAAERGRQIIRAGNACAWAEGLYPGLTLADARAAVPLLQTVLHDEAADAALITWLARAATRWSPFVAARPPHGLLIDISGCAHLFGGEAGLVAEVVGWLARRGLTARAALAATPAAALALARFGAARLADLPLAALSDSDAVQVALRRAGLKRLGDVAGLPRAALAARFGPALVAARDALLQAVPEPLDPLLPVAAVRAEQRFASPIASVDAVRASLSGLIAMCAGQMAARGEGGRRFCLTLYRSDGHVAQVAVETAAPQRDAAVLLRLFDERIAALNDPLDPGFGYDLVRLDVPVIAPLAEVQAGLEGEVLAGTRLAELVDRLAARLGHGRLLRLARADSHVPERASHLAPLATAACALPWPTPAPGEPPARPIRLFEPPQPIEVLAEVPDGPPRRFRWRGQHHDVAAAEGPERIAAEWWRRKDGAGLTRDYWRVETADGRRLWLLRHGIYGAEAQHPRWYVHGLFA